MIEFLIKRGADVNKKDNDWNKFPLYFSIDEYFTPFGKLVIDLLISSGAEINAKDNVKGWTALHKACSNYETAIDLLIRRAQFYSSKYFQTYVTVIMEIL